MYMLLKLFQQCCFCGARCDNFFRICNPCHKELPWVKTHCINCGHPISNEKKSVCEHCIDQKRYYDTIISPFYYQEPLSKLVTSFKFRHELGMARVLAELITPYFVDYYDDHTTPDIIIPIPLHNKRLKERGFNQCIEIGKHVSKSLQIPLERHVAKRIRNTPAQHKLNEKDRKHNLKKAFQIDTNIKSCHVAVLDDVFTTGTTMKLFCEQLKKTGVRQVDAWCVTITSKDVL